MFDLSKVNFFFKKFIHTRDNKNKIKNIFLHTQNKIFDFVFFKIILNGIQNDPQLQLQQHQEHSSLTLQ